jgi:hypothetical protein
LTSTKAFVVPLTCLLLTKVQKTFCLFFIVGVTPDKTSLAKSLYFKTKVYITRKIMHILPVRENYKSQQWQIKMLMLQPEPEL